MRCGSRRDVAPSVEAHSSVQNTRKDVALNASLLLVARANRPCDASDPSFHPSKRWAGRVRRNARCCAPASLHRASRRATSTCRMGTRSSRKRVGFEDLCETPPQPRYISTASLRSILLLSKVFAPIPRRGKGGPMSSIPSVRRIDRKGRGSGKVSIPLPQRSVHGDRS